VALSERPFTTKTPKKKFTTETPRHKEEKFSFFFSLQVLQGGPVQNPEGVMCNSKVLQAKEPCKDGVGELKAKDVGQLGNQGPLGNLSGGGAFFVVDQEKIAERSVDEVEANVAADLIQITIVLDQPLEE